jgi:DNA-binding NtrC family response regulator
MELRSRIEDLVEEMLDGHILLVEAVNEFEKLYIQAALARNDRHLCNTAAELGIHRNTLSKRVAEYDAAPKRRKRSAATNTKTNGRRSSR